MHSVHKQKLDTAVPTENSEIPPITTLPLQNILNFLDISDLSHMRQTSKLFFFHSSKMLNERVDKLFKNYEEYVNSFTDQHELIKKGCSKASIIDNAKQIFQRISRKSAFQGLMDIKFFNPRGIDLGFKRQVLAKLQKTLLDAIESDFALFDISEKIKYVDNILKRCDQNNFYLFSELLRTIGKWINLIKENDNTSFVAQIDQLIKKHSELLLRASNDIRHDVMLIM